MPPVLLAAAIGLCLSGTDFALPAGAPPNGRGADLLTVAHPTDRLSSQRAQELQAERLHREGLHREALHREGLNREETDRQRSQQETRSLQLQQQDRAR